MVKQTFTSNHAMRKLEGKCQIATFHTATIEFTAQAFTFATLQSNECLERYRSG